MVVDFGMPSSNGAEAVVSAKLADQALRIGFVSV